VPAPLTRNSICSLQNAHWREGQSFFHDLEKILIVRIRPEKRRSDLRFRSAALHREARISPLKARMDVERKRYAADAQTANAFLVFPTNASEFPNAGPFPFFRVFHHPPAHRVQMNGNGRRERARAGVTRR